jgi:hypothetical protein
VAGCCECGDEPSGLAPCIVTFRLPVVLAGKRSACWEVPGRTHLLMSADIRKSIPFFIRHTKAAKLRCCELPFRVITKR